MKKILFVCLLGFAVNALASENYCHDAAEIKTWDEVIAKHSTEPLLIKLYSMRVGLCQMVDEGKIDLDTAIDVFEAERSKVDTKEDLKGV
jgi:hypothetical protein